jgi:Mrp family chromosome partitioning ATPase
VFGAAQGTDASWTALKFARALAQDSRVVLAGFGPADVAIRATSSDPSASGLAELANGIASFRDIITKDKQSSLHLISSGHSPTDRSEILSSLNIATSFAALARSYDHVVIAAGAIVGPELEGIAAIAPNAVLIAGTLTNAGMTAARERLFGAGFEDVMLVASATASAPQATAAAA